MYSLPSVGDIKKLSDFKEPYCVTIYAPFIEEGTGENPNGIQLKNMLSKAEQLLESQNISSRTIRKTTRPVKALLAEKGFWHLRGAGLALFAHPNKFVYYLLPDTKLDYLLEIGTGFNTDQLVRASKQERTFYLLSVSHKQVRFYQGGKSKLTEVFIDGLPKNLHDDLRIDEYKKASESHPVTLDSFGRNQEAYHGQYNKKEVDKIELFRFFKHIDTNLHKYLKDKSKPLVFAGVKYLFPIYKKANTYRFLHPLPVAGNPDHESETKLRQTALSVLGTKT